MVPQRPRHDAQEGEPPHSHLWRISSLSYFSEFPYSCKLKMWKAASRNFPSCLSWFFTEKFSGPLLHTRLQHGEMCWEWIPLSLSSWAGKLHKLVVKKSIKKIVKKSKKNLRNPKNVVKKPKKNLEKSK